MYARASSPTSPSSVAEKNIVWRLLREPADDAVDLRLEAHVEHPVGLVEDEDLRTRERSTSRRSTRSSSRPGVATRTWAPLARLAWARSGTPP